jgi:hypothetical protein
MVRAADAATIERIARFGAAAGALGIDVGGIAQAMPLVGEVPAEVELGLSAAGDAMALAVTAPHEDDWADRLGKLARLLGADPAPVQRLFHARPARELRLELASTPKRAGLAATLRFLGDVPLDDDLDSALLAGIPDVVRFVFAERAALLARDGGARGNSGALTVRLALEEETAIGLWLTLSGDEPSLPDAMGRVVAIAEALGIGLPQRALFEKIHPVLAAGGAARVGVSATPRGMRPVMTVAWDAAPWFPRGWDTALRVATGLHPGADAARRVGTFEGALGTAALAGISIDFGPTDPPAGWIWARPR